MLGQVLNNFRWFEVSHLVMFIVLYAVLLVHPIPGLPKDHGQGRSVTWVRLSDSFIPETLDPEPAAMHPLLWLRSRISPIYEVSMMCRQCAYF